MGVVMRVLGVVVRILCVVMPTVGDGVGVSKQRSRSLCTAGFLCGVEIGVTRVKANKHPSCGKG